MTLQLDPRQRAMLAEMGIKLWARPGTAAPAETSASASVNATKTEAASAYPDSGAATNSPANEAARAAPRGTDGAGVGAAGAALGPRSDADSAAAAHGTASGPATTPAPTAARAGPQRRQPPPAHLHTADAAGAAPAIALTPPPAGIEQMDWPALQTTVAECRACGLCATRTHTVFGVGSLTANWMVVGEAPGEQEDRLGEPFVGQAGKLLDQMLAALGLTRETVAAIDSVAARADGASAAGPNRLKNDVYIANVLKCRPPHNRNPAPEEIAQCEPYLRRQVALVQPRIILAMGRFAVQSLLQTTEPIGRLRGRVHHYQGVPVIVTYHPAYLLRALNEKAKAWQDLCLALATCEQAATQPSGAPPHPADAAEGP